jgi:hypothetical protein
MPGIPREVAEHSLDILPHSRAVQQRLRASTRSGVGQSERSCGSSSRLGSSRKCSTPLG